MPCVSVIIPIYGVEKFIERCARSLFEQTLKNIEFIFVNDCTKDNSMEILDKILLEYPDRKDQVVIINHESNKGLPAARKSGLQVATGDYIINCDSDDWIDSSMYEKLYKSAIIQHADIVTCGYIVTDRTSEAVYLNSDTNKESYMANCLYQKYSGSLCVKLFRRTLFDNSIIYPNDAMAEDITLSLQLIYYSKKIVCVEEALYYYYSNIDSISKSLNPERIYNRFQQACNNIIIIEKFLKQKSIYDKYKKPLRCFKHHQRNILIPLLKNDIYYSAWKNSFSGLNHLVLFMPISIKDKILFILRYFKLKY